VTIDLFRFTESVSPAYRSYRLHDRGSDGRFNGRMVTRTSIDFGRFTLAITY
jgi:hypothetical protein